MLLKIRIRKWFFLIIVIMAEKTNKQTRHRLPLRMTLRKQRPVRGGSASGFIVGKSSVARALLQKSRNSNKNKTMQQIKVG